jgi:hypothetical protein
MEKFVVRGETQGYITRKKWNARQQRLNVLFDTKNGIKNML